MARDMAKIRALTQFTLNIRVHGTHHLERIAAATLHAKDLAIDVRQNAGVLVGLAPDHHAIHVLKMRFHLIQGFNSAVDG